MTNAECRCEQLGTMCDCEDFPYLTLERESNPRDFGVLKTDSYRYLERSVP